MGFSASLSGRSLFILVGALSLVACGGDDDTAPMGSCETSSDCGAGLVCRDNRCVGVVDSGTDTGPADTGGTDTAPPDTGLHCPPVERCGGLCCDDSEECVEAMCLPVCETLRCGGDNTCCAAGELCIGEACVEPGNECVEELLDCAVDEICDPTIGRCLPRPEGRCEYFPPSGVFEPEEQWHWSGSDVEPTYVQVMMTPVVGDVTGDGVPEVVFMTYGPMSYGSRGVLRVVRGDTGEELFSITHATLCGDSGIALGDLDGDGTPEIVTAGPCRGSRMLAFSNTGELIWESRNVDGTPYTLEPYGMDFGAPSIADLEGDGAAEVIFGATVLESDGTLRFANPPSSYGCCAATSPRAVVSAVYDADADGALEIVTAQAVYEADGSTLWEDRTLPVGFIGVGDFFADDIPDIVVVHSGNVSIVRASDGERLFGPVPQPGGGRGGPPTIADFDGDGLPEIGIAGAMSYSVFDPDGDENVLWSQTTQDTSSNITGSSVFDFDGDGRAEVVYNDECYMRIYAGADGEVVAQVPQNSHTLIEYPVIADVDADGNTEIVFAANAAVNRCAAIPGFTGLLAGVRVFRDAADNWVGTRKVWNQHAYSVTNIREDLGVPSTVVPNWRRFNSFRQNPQSFDAPDLVGEEASAVAGSCTPGQVLRANVVNNGLVSVGPGLAVTFYIGEPDGVHRAVGTARTTGALVPGAMEIVEFSYEVPAAEVGVDVMFFFRADDVGDNTGENNECLEDNNVAAGSFRCTAIE